MLLGLVSGLIYITKTNACAPAAVIIIYVVLYRIFHGDFKIIPLGFVSLIFVFLIVFTTFYRNYSAFNGDFMADVSIGEVMIGTASPVYIFVNVLKNLITLGFERNAELINGGIKALGKVFHINVNAPEISFYSLPFGFRYSLNHDYAGAHLVTPFFLIISVISLAYLVKRRTKTEGLMFALILQMFSILIILRWQPWGGRLILPALVVAVVPIVYYFSEITKFFCKNSLKYKISYLLMLEIIFQCGLCLSEILLFHAIISLRNMNYPRYARYWQDTEGLKRHINVLQVIDDGHYNNIGFYGTEGMPQYPFLARYVPQGKKIECVTLSENETEEKNLNPDFSPDIIFVSDNALDSEKIYTCNGNQYKCIYSLADDDDAENSHIYHHSVWIKNAE